MLWPIGETLDLIEPDVSRQLVPAEAFAHARDIAAFLPEAMSAYYFECRLSAHISQVDFLTCVTALDKGREIFVGSNGGNGLPVFLQENPVWEQILAFSRHWTDTSSLLHAQVPLMWLEFDQVDSPLPEVPLPSFSFCIDPLYMYRASTPHHVNMLEPHVFRQIVDTGFQSLLGHPLPLDCHNTLLSCFDSLPAGGQIIHLSAMLARLPAYVKVYGSVPRNTLVSYLRKIGWPGSITTLTDILSTFCTSSTFDDNLYIDLTLGETVKPRIGIAFAQQQIGTTPDQDPTRRVLVEKCVENGLCRLEKRDALLSWPGSFRTFFSGETWPARFRKWLDIKLVYHPDYPLEAKGYLGFMPQFSLF